MTGNLIALEERFIVLAPIGRDAQLICAQLQRNHVLCAPNRSSEEALRTAEAGAAGLILTEEAITQKSLADWQSFVRRQPAWSDFPFLLISSGEQDPSEMARIEEVRSILQNVTVVDRPISIRLLLSTVNAALRARKRQYEMRDAMSAQKDTQEALRQAERMAVSGRLLATITHEINNPLAAVANLVYLAENQAKENEVRYLLSTAQEELMRIAEIIQNTLRLTRDTRVRSFTSVAPLVESSVALFRHKLNRSDISLSISVPAGLQVCCTPGEIRQALVNLIANSVDAMPNGGKLRICAKRLTVNSQSGVMLYVADNGSGIPKHARTRLFEQFFTTKGSSGTGVGLWLTQDLLRRNGGRIRFRSRDHGHTGTVFALWIPSVEVATSPTGDQARERVRVA